MRRSRFWIGLVCGLVLAGLFGWVLHPLQAGPRRVEVYVNGNWVGSGLVSDGVAYVPLRSVSQALGARVEYVEHAGRVDVSLPSVVGRTRPPQIEPPAESQTQTVYITRTGAKYHRAGCRYLRRSSIPITRGDALRQGYTPCSVCQP